MVTTAAASKVKWRDDRQRVDGIVRSTCSSGNIQHSKNIMGSKHCMSEAHIQIESSFTA
jgi:hypothetical protein